MKISIILTINNRSPEVSRQVADSFKLPGNEADEIIVVLDRPTTEARAGAISAYTDMHSLVRFTEVEGLPGWKGPAKAWNEGFKAATGDLLYCISSEVVQEAGNIDKARKLCEGGNTIVFGSCHNSTKEIQCTGTEFDPGLLVSSKMPRPLGFIVCIPSEKVREIRGFDEEFMKGFWFDDDDFFLRMWHTGLDFIFDDSIHGIHLHHPRPVLSTEEGKAGILRNREYMMKKHGTIHPWPDLLRIEESREGRLTWKHV